MVKIETVMQRDVLKASKEDTVLHLLEDMHKNRVGAIIVVNHDDNPIGIITERDVIRGLLAFKEEFTKKQAQDIMTSPVLTIEPEEDIESASIQMSLNRIRRIPVVKNEKLIGLISYRDIANALRKSYYILEEKTEVLKEQASRDPLTGLYNRTFINEQMKLHMADSKKTGNPMSVTMIDIDFFKKVNDTYGHQCGDMVLKKLSDILVAKSREINIVGRFGGEEFIIVGPISDYKTAIYAAERLRQAIVDEPFEWEGKKFNITISLGVALWNKNIRAYKELIKAADTALYTAKHNGRNRVELADYEMKP